MFRTQQLNGNITKQINSLFVGTVLNQGSLIDYADTKNHIAYSAGYSHNRLANVQKTITQVQLRFSNIYQDFRRELMHRISMARPYAYFSICDAYIRQFMAIDYISEKELLILLDKYVSQR